MKKRIIFLLLIPGFLTKPALAEKDKSKKVERASDRLIAFNTLDKITVGPEDNFQGVVDQSGDVLIFTRLAQQASSLFKQDLKSDKVEPFLAEQGDAKDPVLSPNNALVAFTYFKNNSRGDICIRSLKGSDLQCLDSQESADTEPFWLDDNTLAFVSRDFRSDRIGLKSYSLNSKKITSLYEGDVSAPTSFQNGKAIIFSAFNKNLQKNTLFRLERGNTKAEALLVDLPGMSSFPRMSADGAYLYFSQYMNDSNNDKTIDGKDNGVIFRAAVAKLQAGKSIFPEQMTSVETNCSYAFPGTSWLWLTCAYEGSLDIYKLPREG
ncbi:MAG: hypothetical protein KBD78_16725, partial [Oligoflexales bacterium]|nr:hypothetical protein [Oligoflexales bacterium]